LRLAGFSPAWRHPPPQHPPAAHHLSDTEDQGPGGPPGGPTRRL